MTRPVSRTTAGDPRTRPLRRPARQDHRPATSRAAVACARTTCRSRASSRICSAASTTPHPTTSAKRSSRYMAARPCPVCNGARLKPESLAVLVNDQNIVDVASMSDPRVPRPGSTHLAIDPDREPGRAADRARVPDRPPDPEGDPRAARLSGRRRSRLPHARPLRQHALRRRGPAHPPRHPDRLAA